MDVAEREASRSRWSPVLLLTGLCALAFALRFWRLGDWSFEGDEIFTLRDSLNPRLTNPRPLIYFLNHYLVQPLLPLDEFGLRVLPALFGVLAVPAVYLVGRHVIGQRAALFGALLLAVNPLHVHQSTSARYWSLVFLLSAVYPFALYLGIRDRKPRAVALGVVTGVLAVLAHPVSILLVGGLGIWVVATYWRPGRGTALWSNKSVRWGALGVVVLTAAVLMWFLPLLRRWMLAHGGGKPTEHLLFLPGREGIKQILLLLSYVEGLTLPLVLAAALGIFLVWRSNRSLALLLSCLFLFPVGFIILLSVVTAVSTTYMMPAAPVVFFAAGIFLDRVARVAWDVSPRWLLPATVAVMIIATGMPTLLSQYRDGRRHDFRGVAVWLEGELGAGDRVLSDQAKVLSHYLPGRQVERLTADTLQLREAARENTAWIVAPYSARGGHRTNPRLGGFKGWIYDNCQLRGAVGVARLDFRQNELQIYRCPPVLAGTACSARTTP